MNYPYQLVAFIDPDSAVTPHPPIGTPIYSGPQGWIPNVAIKRRFALNSIDESELLKKLADFCHDHATFGLTFTRVVEGGRVPESVLEVSPVTSLTYFHNDFITYFGDMIQSRYPDREGAAYYPHMTLTWHGKQVVDPKDYFPPRPPHDLDTRHVSEVCLVKDIDGENSQVLAYFTIGE